MKKILVLFTLLGALMLAGCGRGSKQDIMNKVKVGMTKDEVEKALGKADGYDAVDVPFLGKNETLKYNGSDGVVAINVQNGKVLVIGSGEEKKSDK